MKALYQRKEISLAAILLTIVLLSSQIMGRVYAIPEPPTPPNQGTGVGSGTGTGAGVGVGGSSGINLTEGPDAGVLKTFVSSAYNIVLPLAIIIGLILLVVGGYTFMTSQGDPKKTMEAKERLTSAIMGLLFVLLSIGILRILIGSLITGSNPGF